MQPQSSTHGHFLRCIFTFALGVLFVLLSHAAAPNSHSASPLPGTPDSAGVFPLKHLLFGDTQETAGKMITPTDGRRVVTQNVSGLEDLASLEAALSAFYGQPITMALIQKIGQAIGKYLQEHDRLVVDVMVPNQTVADGSLRLAIIVGRYKDLKFHGNRWFSGSLLQKKLGIKPGEEVRLSTLEEAVNWTNTNPFRRIRVLVNDLDNEPGKADLMVAVNERFPLKVAASYDNTGIQILGQSHYTASLLYGNLWGLDHQLSYAYTSTDYRKVYEVHSLDYRIPLPWRHSVQINGAYAKVRPTFGDGWFNQKGESVIGSLRYLIAKEKGVWSSEYAIGTEFKQSNNNLEFGGFQYQANRNDTFQLTLGTTLGRKDPLGMWVLGLNINASPGGLNRRNSREIYFEARYLANPRYLTGTLLLQRLTKFGMGFELLSRGQLQLASTNLLGAEQMTIGGQGTVRGYRERIFSGDEGCLLSHELQGPVWTFAMPKSTQFTPPMQLRLVSFWDYSRVYYNRRIASDIKLDPLMSAGIGLRANMGYQFSVTADYGWQIKQTTYRQPEGSRGHIRVSLSY